MTTSEIESMVERAVSLFKDGYNCSQSVFAACAPQLYGMEESLALRISASFGGGIGRMRHVCGAASGMFLLAGLQNGSSEKGDAVGKQNNYALVQQLAEQFKQENGSIICAELLGLAAPSTNNPDFAPAPAARTEQYYAKRPCVEMVASAVRIYLNQYIQNH